LPYVSYPYQWSNTTTEPPAVGTIRANSTDPTATVLLWISEQTHDATDVSTILPLLVNGDAIRVKDQTDGASYQWFGVTAPAIQKTGYVEVAVAWNSGGDPIKPNRQIDVLLVAPAASASAYATVDDLAQAVRVQVSAKTSPLLEAALAAATVEIDHEAGRRSDDPIPFDDPLAHEICIARGVEWYKANDAAFGALGFDGTGVLAVPTDPFARHATTLVPLKQTFGIA